MPDFQVTDEYVRQHLVVNTNPPVTPTLPVGDNQTRIDAILAGRSPHFTFSYPADPVITRSVTVNTAAEFNTEAAISGTQITIGSSLTGQLNVQVDDISVIMDNSLTLDGGLWMVSPGLGQTFERVRWTGGNIKNIYLGRVSDVLFDDVFAVAVDAYKFESSGSMHNIGFGGRWERVAFINTTLRNEGSSPNSGDFLWALFANDGGTVQGSDGLIVGNVKVETDQNSQNNRITNVHNVMLFDSVFNPDGVSANGMRIHLGCTNVWVRDCWSRDLFKLDRSGSETTAQMINGVFDNYDRFGTIAYALFPPASDEQSTGTIQNSTWNSPTGSALDYGPLTNGGGNSLAVWDQSTVPDHSAIGAIRS